MALREQPHSLQEHEVLYLDFLGFAEAVQRWNDKQMGKLIAVMVAIADAQSEYDVKGEPQSDGSYKITATAEITTFSDHIVMSYPRIVIPAEVTDEIREVLADGWDGMVRERMQAMTAQVAMAGLEIGLLVRGGLSRGKLYHHGRVVVGEAMIDAYHLEKEVARHPRVVISPRIRDDVRLFKDEDGVRYLDYVGAMMLLAEDRHGDARVWAEKRLVEIEATIKGLRRDGQSHKADKWDYFRDQLSHTMETWN